MIKICKSNTRLVLILLTIILILVGVLLFTDKVDINLVKKNNNVVDIIKSTQKTENTVVRVVDGDTIIIRHKEEDERVRLVGLNTPESKAINGRVVECFGKEATQKAKEILRSGQKVKFENDGSQSKRDKYGRLLGYIFLENGQNFAELMIREGYGYEYTYHGREYKYQKEFKNAQKHAQENKKGLWADNICN